MEEEEIYEVENFKCKGAMINKNGGLGKEV